VKLILLYTSESLLLRPGYPTAGGLDGAPLANDEGQFTTRSCTGLTAAAKSPSTPSASGSAKSDAARAPRQLAKLQRVARITRASDGRDHSQVPLEGSAEQSLENTAARPSASAQRHHIRSAHLAGGQWPVGSRGYWMESDFLLDGRPV
jgi:hypothetical protein